MQLVIFILIVQKEMIIKVNKGRHIFKTPSLVRDYCLGSYIKLTSGWAFSFMKTRFLTINTDIEEDLLQQYLLFKTTQYLLRTLLIFSEHKMMTLCFITLSFFINNNFWVLTWQLPSTLIYTAMPLKI